MDELLKTIKAQTSFKPAYISVAATISIISSAAGILHTVNVEQSSCPTLTLYDNASGASGTVLAFIEPGNKQSYVYDETVLVGITASLAAGNTPAVHVSYK